MRRATRYSVVEKVRAGSLKQRRWRWHRIGSVELRDVNGERQREAREDPARAQDSGNERAPDRKAACVDAEQQDAREGPRPGSKESQTQPDHQTQLKRAGQRDESVAHKANGHCQEPQREAQSLVVPAQESWGFAS